MGRANSNTIDHPEIVGDETIQDEEQATPSTVPNHFSSWTPFFMSVMPLSEGCPLTTDTSWSGLAQSSESLRKIRSASI